MLWKIYEWIWRLRFKNQARRDPEIDRILMTGQITPTDLVPPYERVLSERDRR